MSAIFVIFVRLRAKDVGISRPKPKPHTRRPNFNTMIRDYDFRDIEQRWQAYWDEKKTFKAEQPSSKPKYYVLDMFPYPSGAGLHVGHPLGYIASDIYARYKRLKGFNVLHPMGFDAYGLPAEQYAIQTGQHPAITTEENIQRYKKQLRSIGFSFDWDREVRTCDPDYYHWTQWVFIRLFESWYDLSLQKAQPISRLIEIFEKEGNARMQEMAACSAQPVFSAQDWASYDEKQKQQTLMAYRLAYLSDTMVNWCPKLGTVLANDEVVNGLSQRGGYPVERKRMQQWQLRITAYAERLLGGLDSLQWSDALKEMQRNWIGKSHGATLSFALKDRNDKLDIFTTRPDTLFGVSFMVLCPEHEQIATLTTPAQKAAVEAYLDEVKHRTERERQADVNRVSGVFTGAYAIHPFTNSPIPIWISDYVLAGYGTGAIMAVPAHDSRDYRFAKRFNLPIVAVVEGGDISQEAYETKDGVMFNSDFLNGLRVKEAIKAMVQEIDKRGLGTAKTLYRLRDAIFSRQRYWGEPFPIYYKDSMPYPLSDEELPLRLPEVDRYLPTEAGDPPLARAEHWVNKDGHPLETNTMPGFAGSSAYYLRYMDPHNPKALVSQEAVNYWGPVDLYIGGAEHASGHLIYSRFWHKFLFDLGMVNTEEPYQKLINQGMIQGRSSFVYRLNYTAYAAFLEKNPSYCLKGVSEEDVKAAQRLILVSKNIAQREAFTDPVHADIHLVENDVLDMEAFRAWMPHWKTAEFITEEDGRYICGSEVEKMSKSMYNVQNPDEIVERYGADTLRMYEMFLGPIEQSKPWDTQGIEGVYRFLKKFWKLVFPSENATLDEGEATAEELKALHLSIRHIDEDTDRFSFNTAVSRFMITVNQLTDLKCHKRCIIEPFTILLAPYAPHICEEIWKTALGHGESITYAAYPVFEEKYTVESHISYPVSFNGKTRFSLNFPADATPSDIEKAVLAEEQTAKWTEGKSIKKVIVVPKRIVNIVVG